MELQERIGISLKTLRENRGMTQLFVGEACDMTQSMIARYESGNVCPNLPSLIRLADFYGVSIDGLCGRKIR